MLSAGATVGAEVGASTTGGAAGVGAGSAAAAGAGYGRFGCLAFLEQGRNGRIDLHAFGARRNDDPANGAVIQRFDLHRRLVGLDLGDHVTAAHLGAFIDKPFGKRSLFHCRR